MMDTFDAEAVAHELVDHAVIEAAEAVLAEAEAKRDAMVKLAADAERRAVEARHGWDALIDTAAASGQAPSMIEAANLHDEGEHLARYAGLLATVARRMEQPVEEARAALADARHAAWLPVLHRGADLRISAARKRDHARLVGPRGMSAHEVAERERLQAAVLGTAPADFEAGAALINLAIRRGVRFLRPLYPLMDATEQSERTTWERPWSAEELGHAAE